MNLRQAYDSLRTIRDYRIFPIEIEDIEKAITSKIPHCFAIFWTNVSIVENMKYNTNHYISLLCNYCASFFPYCCKQSENKTFANKILYSPRYFDLAFGIYTDTNMEFDIYIGTMFQNHYVMKVNSFTPFTNEKGEFVALSDSICMDYVNIEICNLKQDTDSPRLILLACCLDMRARFEIMKSKSFEFII